MGFRKQRIFAIFTIVFYSSNMYSFHYRIVFTLVITILCVCCDGHEEKSFTQPGKIEGRITTYDADGKKRDHHEEVRISSERAEAEVVYTDSSGYFEMYLSTGTYDLVVAKPGFDSCRIEGVSVLGGEPEAFIEGALIKPVDYVQIVSADWLGVEEDKGSVRLVMEWLDTDFLYNSYAIYLFLSTDSNVSSRNYDLLFKNTVWPLSSHENTDTIRFDYRELRSYEYWYARLYVGPAQTFSYTEIPEYCEIYMGLGNASVPLTISEL